MSIFQPTYLDPVRGRVHRASWPVTLFNLFVGFEVLLAASFVLLTIGGSAERVRAGIAYVMVSMVSSLIFLIGIALVYATTGTLQHGRGGAYASMMSPTAPAPRCSRC